MSEAITRAELERAFRRLDRLSKTEYNQGLSELASRPVSGDWREDLATRQLGRLVGIEMKRPFARPRRLKTPDPYSGARRHWHLYGRKVFERERRRLSGTPHEGVLDLVVDSYTTYTSPESEDTYAIALEVHHETGWLRELAVWLHPHLCEDKSVFNRMRAAMGDAGATAIDLTLATQVAAIVGPLLPVSVPATVLAGLSLFLLRLGASGYCRWAGRLRKEKRFLANDER